MSGEKAGEGRRVAGVRQVARAIGSGTAAQVYIARDAEKGLTDDIRRAALEAGVPVSDADSMAQLGRFCRIQVGTAAAAVLRDP